MVEQKFSFFIKLNFVEMFNRGVRTEEAFDYIEKNFPAPDWSTISDSSSRLLMFTLPDVQELTQEQIAWLNSEPLVKSYETWQDAYEKIRNAGREG